MRTIDFLLARFSEPSSYAGLGALLALVGWHFSDADLGELAQCLAAGCGLAALLLKERGMLQVLVLCTALGIGLGACAPLMGAGVATGALGGGLAIFDRVAGTVNTTVQTACREYQKGKTAANAVIQTGVVHAGAAKKVGIIEEYGDAACANPPSGDALSTAIWLGELVGQIGTLTSPQPAT